MNDLAVRTVTLDFSSSGQGNRTVTQILVDGAVFANAAELPSWNDTRVQVHVCEQCGFEGCADGGWLMARDVGVGVAFLPAFGEMLGGDWEQVKYAPPYFAQGMPVFTPSDYDKLRHWCLGLPPIQAVPGLTGVELLRCLQWEAPARVLGMFPAKIQLNQDLLLAVSDGEIHDAAAILERAIEQTQSASRVWLASRPPAARAVRLYLDAPGTLECTALYTIDNQMWLGAPLPGYIVRSN